jgi:PBSX family phage terminase large subunit
MDLNLDWNGTQQYDFVHSTARFPVYVGGRDSGKTASIVFKMMKYLSENPGADMVGVLPQLVRIKTILIPAMRKFFGEYYGTLWEWKRKDNEIYFPAWGSTCYLKAADDPDTCRGIRVPAAWMDEIAEGNQLEAFLILEAAITETGGDKKYPNQLWAASTPRDTKKWIKQIWLDKQDPVTEEPHENPEEYPLFRMETQDNPFAPEWIKKRARQLKGTRWGRQEYGGEFLSIEGVAFPELRESVHFKRPFEGTVLSRWVTGFDLGASSPTAFVLLGQDTEGRIWALDEYYKRNAAPADWAEWLGENNVKDVRCDPSISDVEMRDWRRRYNLPRMQRAMSVRGKKARRSILADRLQLRGDNKPGLFISPDCPNLWDELQNLAFARVKGQEHTTDDWAPGTQDHAYDALCYGLSKWDKPPLGRPQGYEVVHAR